MKQKTLCAIVVLFVVDVYSSAFSLVTLLPTLPVLVEEGVMTALAKDPRRRFDSVQTFAHTLEQAYKDELEQVRKVEEERIRMVGIYSWFSHTTRDYSLYL